MARYSCELPLWGMRKRQERNRNYVEEGSGLAPEEEIREKQIYQGDMNGRFVYFRHTFFTLGEDMVSFGKAERDRQGSRWMSRPIPRYRLWVNGTAVQSAPSRGDRYRHYYETIDVSEYLVPGENVLAAQVLLCDHSHVKSQYGCDRAPLISVASLPSGHRLAVEGKSSRSLRPSGIRKRRNLDVEKRKTAAEEKVLGGCDYRDGRLESVSDDSFYLVAEPFISDNLGASIEHLDFAKSPTGWKTASLDDRPGGKRMPTSLWSGAILRRMWVCIWIFT